MDLEKLDTQAKKEIQETKDAKTLEALRIKYLGRKSELTKILRSLAQQPLSERKKIGPAANKLKKVLNQLFEKKLKNLKSEILNLKSNIDLTLPGKKITKGHLHILTKVEDEIRDIFKSLNFSVVEGPEVETEYNNFDALNIPQDHPARDMWDTFWLKNNYKNSKFEIAYSAEVTSATKAGRNSKLRNKSQKLLLRTHTSPMQIRYMQEHQPPFQIIVPGRVFRHEATDFSHEFNFHQIEGLMVGEDVSMAHLKFVIEEFFKRFFGKVEVRLRPSYFPFVEPGVEVDMKFRKVGLASRSFSEGWLEMAGAGMVHPNVFKAVGYNPNNVQGFAFGFGMERLAMIKYNIPDIRLFHSGDLRFIRQF